MRVADRINSYVGAPPAAARPWLCRLRLHRWQRATGIELHQGEQVRVTRRRCERIGCPHDRWRIER